MSRRVPKDPFGPARTRPRWLIGGGTAAVTLAVVALLLAGWGLFAYAGPGPKAERGEETTVTLRRGAGLSEIADTLAQAGVIRNASVFMLAARLNGAAGELKAGEYAVPSGAPMTRVLEKIRKGEVVRHFVTIPEGVTSEAAVEILMRNPVLTGAVPVPEEGVLLPQTYDVQRGEDRAAVLQRMIDARTALLRRLWSVRSPDLPVSTPQQAVILASIVEKETGLASERPRVAAVFVNRLRQGMRLESDPTVVYGLTGGRKLGRGLRRSELAAMTPYNTYLIAGLPPGPITNPGEASIAAGTGGHVFAASFDAHLKNVARWRAVERERAAAATAPAPAATAGN